jgi:methylmalonyl-CoA/ethylmalonyl-CoA epimerase
MQEIHDVRKEPSVRMSDIAGSVLGIDHVAVAVVDIEQAMRWYVDTLGFRLVEERITKGANTAMKSAVLSAGSAIVVLVQGLSPRSQVSRFIDHYGPGVQHLALLVKDLGVAVKCIVDAGGAADTPVIEGAGIRQVFLRRDQGSGVRLELIERRGGEFSDDSVDRLFREFEARDLF